MEIEILKIVAQVAGIGGISLGVLLIIFRDVIRKNIFSSLTKNDSYKTIRLILVLVWSIAILGVLGWFFLEFYKIKPQNMKDESKIVLKTEGNGSPIISDTNGDVSLNY